MTGMFTKDWLFCFALHVFRFEEKWCGQTASIYTREVWSGFANSECMCQGGKGKDQGLHREGILQEY